MHFPLFRKLYSAGLQGMTWLMILLLLGCKEKETLGPSGPEGPKEIGKAHVWLTKGDKTKLLDKEGDLSIKDTLTSKWPMITVDTTVMYQTIEGFGAALTGSSAYLLHKKMDGTKRTEILTDLFDTVNGIGISYLRLTIGASDFSLSDFSYDDMIGGETDFDLQHFSLAQDVDDVIPVLKEVLQITPGIKLLGSPWSPPAWMKTNGSMKGGRLKTECYDVYAHYFARYIEEMALQGITITSITPQNEPLNYTASYPCMEMQAAAQADFIKNYLGPTFEAKGITTKILIYDHNWDVPEYPITILDDPDAKKYVAGSAFHAYAGDVTAMSTVHSAHPDRDLYFTEISGGDWATDFSANLMWFTSNILIGSIQNWSTTVLFWNLVLNEYNGPQNNGCGTCRGVITYITYTNSVVKNEEYYAVAHFSKFVRPGAKHIRFKGSADIGNLGVCTFLNPGGSKVMVAANYSTDFKTFSVKQGKKYFSYTLPPKSVVTITW